MRVIAREIDAHGKRFLLGKNGHAGITFLLRQMVTTEAVSEIFLGNNILIKLNFLKAENVGRVLADECVETFFPTGSQAIHIP